MFILRIYVRICECPQFLGAMIALDYLSGAMTRGVNVVAHAGGAAFGAALVQLVWFGGSGGAFGGAERRGRDFASRYYSSSY